MRTQVKLTRIKLNGRYLSKSLHSFKIELHKYNNKKILLKNSKPNNRQSYSPNLIGNNLKLIKQTNWKPRDNLTDIVGLFLKKI